MNTVQEQWIEYKNTVIPKDAGPIQMEETKLAFYSGAFVLINQLTSISEDYTEEQACNIVSGINEEIENYLKSKCKPR